MPSTCLQHEREPADDGDHLRRFGAQHGAKRLHGPGRDGRRPDDNAEHRRQRRTLAATLTAPPRSADHAPFQPASAPASAAIASGGDRLPLQDGAKRAGIDESDHGVARARCYLAHSAEHAHRPEGRSKPCDYSGSGHRTAMKCCVAAAANRRRAGSAARQRADDHELARGRRGRAQVARELAVEEDLDVRPDRALLVDDAELEARIADVESARARRRACDAGAFASTATVSAPLV